MFLDRQEITRSRKYGFPTLWPIADAYEIENGLLRPVNGAPRRYYAPMGRSDLVNAVARLRPGDETELLRFARRYGLLGYDQLMQRESPGRRRGGDPVVWMWAQAKTVRLCQDLLLALHERDDARLHEILDKIEADTDPIIAAAGTRIVIEMSVIHPTIEARARSVVRSWINANIEGIHQKLFDAKERDKLFFTFRALVEVLYWKLGLELVRGTPHGIIKRCEAVGCDGIFLQTDGRQRFCPPTVPKTESPCAIRQRLREYRDPRLRQKRERQRRNKKGGSHHGTSRRKG